MPTPPYAKVLIAVDAGVPTAGIATITGGETLTISYESTVAWPTDSQARLELYSYPEGYAGPGAPWVTEVSEVTRNGITKSYTAFVYTGNTPPPFTAPLAAEWGKYLFRLVVASGVKDGRLHEDMTDVTAGLEILSPKGLHDVAWSEGEQFATEFWRGWTGDQAANLRAIDTALAGIPALYSSTPTAITDSTGSAGASAQAAKGDHKHPLGANLTLPAAASSTIQKAAASGAPSDTLLLGQAGDPVGSIGGNLILGVGAGTVGAAPGQMEIRLHDDGSASGNLVVTGGAFGTFVTVNYIDASSTVLVTTAKNILTLNAAVSQILKINSNVVATYNATGLVLDASLGLFIGSNPVLSAPAAVVLGGNGGASLEYRVAGGETQTFYVNNAGKFTIAETLITAAVALQTADLAHTGTNLGFFSTAATTKQEVTGSRGGNAALESLLTALAAYGIITNSTSA